MGFNNSASMPLSSLSPQKTLQLVDVDPGNACNGIDHDMSLDLRHDTDVPLPQANKIPRGTEVQTVISEIATALIDLGKLLEKRSRGGGEAQVSNKKAEKLG